MSAKAIRYWLMRRPRPAFVRMVTNGEASEMEIEARVSWARVAESVEAMDADRVEALTPQKTVIRVCKPAELDDSEPEAETTESEAEPPAPAAVVTDPETARFSLFANLLSQAYKHSNDVAFARLVDVLDRVAAREDQNAQALAEMRAKLDELAEERLDEAAEAAEAAKASNGLLGELAGAFAGGAAQAGGGSPPTPPNGKAH